MSLLEGSEYEYFFFVTNTDLSSEKVVISYEKRGKVKDTAIEKIVAMHVFILEDKE